MLDSVLEFARTIALGYMLASLGTVALWLRTRSPFKQTAVASATVLTLLGIVSLIPAAVHLRSLNSPTQALVFLLALGGTLVVVHRAGIVTLHGGDDD